jgi:5-methyltetrahydropteroyltriglutamate--homocysteine methyltransferase
LQAIRAEVIGSLLRPGWLKDARTALQEGRITPAEFKSVEDRAVDEAVAQQEAAGVDIITDGELRRSSFLGPLTDAVDGYGPINERIGAQSQWKTKQGEHQVPPRMVTILSKLRRRRSNAAEEFSYLRARANRTIKVTLPSPLMMALLWSPKHSRAVYPDPFQLFSDAVDIIRSEVRELAELGCTYIQIDAPELATLVDPNTRQRSFEDQGVPAERLLDEGIEMLNSVACAPGVTFGLHLCRGNNAGAWMASGGYESISKQVFRGAKAFDIFLLEYDSPRAGNFEPLADLPSDKRVVLGLISTKTDSLEAQDELIARIDEAARFFPRDRMALSTQCGFASVAAGNPIRPETQPAKLRLVADTAHRAWPTSENARTASNV